MANEKFPLTLREEHRSRTFENRMLRRILGPKRDEATGNWRRLHNEGLSDLYSSPNIMRTVKEKRASSTYERGKVHTGIWR
jgi:hypothetical protein